jgi:hypothetical protein
LGAAANCVFQILWFSRTCLHNIDFDGISYVGIAHHLAEGDFRGSINAFRSPLASWLIALFWPSEIDPLLIGKFLTIGSFLGCAALLYFLTRSLWNSNLAASVAVLCFTLGRGVIAESVLLVSADFWLTFLVLIYFIVLLRCLRHQDKRDWLILGGVHAVAFLAKAFALPWLAFITLVAVLASSKMKIKESVQYIALAALLPCAVSTVWAIVLHSKYEVYTAGSQLKTNLLQWTLKEKLDINQQGYVFLHDTSRTVDSYLVGDPMPSGAHMWQYRFSMNRVVPAVIRAEIRNIPMAIKEIAILITPGGMLAFLFGLIALAKKRKQYFIESQFALVVLFACVSLVLAYCMLVFDGRYALPLIPLLLAISIGFLFNTSANGSSLMLSKIWRTACILLLAAGFIFSTLYWASPFRTLNRDYQLSCYDAGWKLKSHQDIRIISVGSGPYPEHGVGWEAGYKAAFFGKRAIIAESDLLPNSTELNGVLADIAKATPNAVMVWGEPHDIAYKAFITTLNQNGHVLGSEKINDPAKGEVGTIVYLKNASSVGS